MLYDGRTVACIDMSFLHEGLPPMKLEAEWKAPKHSEPELPEEGLTGYLNQLMSELNIASKEWVIRQYDHEVQGGTVIKPLVGVANDGPSDAGVVRPLLDSMAGIVVSNGMNPCYGDIDTYHMTACAIDEAIRNSIAVGGSLNRSRCSTTSAGATRSTTRRRRRTASTSWRSSCGRTGRYTITRRPSGRPASPARTR